MKNKPLTILLTIFALCTCLFTLTACELESDHVHSYTTQVVEPTCTEQGYTTYVCECGDTYKDNYVNAQGHSFTNYVSNNDATYEADGTKTATCDRDNCYETDAIIDEGSKLIPGKGLEYSLNSDGQSYSVTGIGTCEYANIIIPSTYENKPVTHISNYAFYWCKNLTSITIANSVMSIGDFAFSGCSKLTNIEIPNSVTSIGTWAFGQCDSLTSIEIPNSVTCIGDGAFRNCYKLVEVINKSTHITVIKGAEDNGY